jgi:transglutaminase-like putative cysteine protease
MPSNSTHRIPQQEASARMNHWPPGQWPAPGPEFLESTYYLDWATPEVRAFAERAAAGETSAVGRAVRLFYAVRDGWRYDAFSIRLDPRRYVASHVLKSRGVFCIPKAVLLTAALRAAGIPAGIGLSDVVNHLTTEKLKAKMGGKTAFIHHGYAVIWLDGRWVKAAPAFNIEMCERFGVRPTEFDGRSDAIFQEFDVAQRRHMEYTCDHGLWSDFPYERIERDFRDFYPAELFAEAPDERFEEGTPVR